LGHAVMVAINLRHVPPGTRIRRPASGRNVKQERFGGALRRFFRPENSRRSRRTLLLMAQFMAFGQGNWDE
jgi:hypothetical protein